MKNFFIKNFFNFFNLFSYFQNLNKTLFFVGMSVLTRFDSNSILDNLYMFLDKNYLIDNDFDKEICLLIQQYYYGIDAKKELSAIMKNLF